MKTWVLRSAHHVMFYRMVCQAVVHDTPNAGGRNRVSMRLAEHPRGRSRRSARCSGTNKRGFSGAADSSMRFQLSRRWRSTSAASLKDQNDRPNPQSYTRRRQAGCSARPMPAHASACASATACCRSALDLNARDSSVAANESGYGRLISRRRHCWTRQKHRAQCATGGDQGGRAAVPWPPGSR